MRLLKSQLINLIKENLNENTRQDPEPPKERDPGLPIASYLVYPTLTKISKKQLGYLEKAKDFVFGNKEYLIAAGFNLFWVTTYFPENPHSLGTQEYHDHDEDERSYRGLTEIYKTQHNEIFNDFDMKSGTIKPTYSVAEAHQRIKNMINNLHASLDKHFQLLSNPKVMKRIGSGKSINYSNERYQLLLPHDVKRYFNPTQADKIQLDLGQPMRSKFDKASKHVYSQLNLGGESIEKKSWITYTGVPESIKPDELSKYFKVIEGNYPKVVMDQKIKELL